MKMRASFLKIILIGSIIALFTLALAPAMAIAAADNMGSHCDTMAPANEPAPDSCLTHCMIIQCRLSSAGDARIVNFATSRNDEQHICLNTRSVGETASTECSNAVPPRPIDGSPPHIDVTYQCRNSLSSEDPASL